MQASQVDGHVMPLSARINGYVMQVPVIEGQLVHAGDVLVTIDPQDYKVAVEQAEASLADAMSSAASSRFNVPITSVTTDSSPALGGQRIRKDTVCSLAKIDGSGSYDPMYTGDGKDRQQTDTVHKNRMTSDSQVIEKSGSPG